MTNAVKVLLQRQTGCLQHESTILQFIKKLYIINVLLRY
jgi:hypothetical protein